MLLAMEAALAYLAPRGEGGRRGVGGSGEWGNCTRKGALHGGRGAEYIPCDIIGHALIQAEEGA